MAASSGRRSRARPLHPRRRKPRASKRAKNPLMRHRNYGSKLGRQPAHRRATLRNLVTNVIEKERITTTITRARAAKPIVEQMITLGKRDTLHSRRQAAAYLMTPGATKKLFADIAPRFFGTGLFAWLPWHRRLASGDHNAPPLARRRRHKITPEISFKRDSKGESF